MPKHVTMPLLAPLWIAGKQDVGVAGSASFRGDKLLSYGTVICQRVKAKGQMVYLLNDSRYSDSTTHLQNLLRAALHDAGARTLEVPGVGLWSSAEFFDHDRILREFDAASVELAREATQYRQPKRARLEAEAQTLMERAKAYREMFGIKSHVKKTR